MGSELDHLVQVLSTTRQLRRGKPKRNSQVINKTVGDGGDVEQSVNQIDTPVVTRLDGRKFEAEHAECRVILSVGITRIANDSLGRPILASPVTPPSRLVAVAIDIVASQEDILFVGVEERVPDSEDG